MCQHTILLVHSGNKIYYQQEVVIFYHVVRSEIFSLKFFFFSVFHFILLSFTCMCHHIMAVYLMVNRKSGRGNAG